MASRNVISEKHAASISVIIDRGPRKQHTFINTIRKSFRSLGETNLKISFPDNPSEKIWQTFAVVKNYAAALIIMLGDPFLRMTETLTVTTWPECPWRPPARWLL
jgi:hypothetical protein